MKATVLLNQRSGASPTGQDMVVAVREAFQSAGVEADVRMTSGETLKSEAEAALRRGADVIVAAGGDGTLNAVASALAGGDTPLGVLALGTLNHFAKDLGIPLDLAEAARVIAHGRVAAVDVGRVNDRIFINNSSLGLYAWALIDRDQRRHRFGWSKWPAMGMAMLKTFRLSPLLHVVLQTDGASTMLKTPLVFVGNNRYELDRLNIGARSCLSRGELSLYVATTASRWGLIKLAVRAAIGRLRQSRDFETQCVSAVRVETRRRHVHVALDGEVTQLRSPLAYRTWPGALRVIVPVDDGLMPGEPAVPSSNSS